jgi:hypothetical protein
VSSRGSDLVAALGRAALEKDAGVFDAVFDRVLERARDEAEPEGDLSARVAGRLSATLGGTALPEDSLEELAVGEASVSPLGAVLRGGGGRAVRLATGSSRWLRYAQGLGLVAAGVAIGFVWGRSPLWWPSDGLPIANTLAARTGTEVERADSPLTLEGNTARVSEVAPVLEVTSAPEVTSARSMPDKAPRVAVPPSAGRSTSKVESSLARHSVSGKTSAADSLRFALEQLRKAQLLLRASEPKRALAVLDGLDARVAVSVLEEEREVTRLLALCDAGEVAKASALARRFRERVPDSAYAVSVRESCVGKAALLDEMRLEQMPERTSNPPR